MSAIAWIALIGAFIAGTQAWIAHRKLRLDLFDKRFQSYEDVNQSINDRHDDITRNDRLEKPELDLEILNKFWRHQRKMKILFPSDVWDAVDRVEKALMSCDTCFMKMKHSNRIPFYTDMDDFKLQYETWMKAETELREAQDILGTTVRRYIYQYGIDEVIGISIRKTINTKKYTARLLRKISNYKN